MFWKEDVRAALEIVCEERAKVRKIIVQQRQQNWLLNSAKFAVRIPPSARRETRRRLKHSGVVGSSTTGNSSRDPQYERTECSIGSY